jgi:hypothetical protein
VIIFTPRPLYPGERALGSHFLRDRTGPIVDLEAMEKRIISCLCRESNLDSPTVQSVAWSLYLLSYPGSKKYVKWIVLTQYGITVLLIVDAATNGHTLGLKIIFL